MAEKILLPALKAHIGDWKYYLSFLKMRDIAERVKPAEEIHPSKTLNELIQRRLKERSSQIKDYLLNQPQRFINTLVIGVYEGKPEWYEIEIKNSKHLKSDDLPISVGSSFGLLQLRGDEILFPLDGQHRVEGIKSAVKQNDSIGDEEVGVIFVGHKNDKAGLERTRRLFTTLNRYAKPVSKKDSIALDEDDVVAIVTRRLVDESSLFYEKISLVESKNLPPSDSRNFTSIVALYDAMDIYLRGKSNVKDWSNYKKKRPSDIEVNDHYRKANDYLKMLIRRFDWLADYAAKEPADNIAVNYRNDQGGYLLFRPVGLLLVTQVVKSLIDSGKTLAQTGLAISQLPMTLAKKPWDGLLWDSVNQRMITSPANQQAAQKLALYLAGGDIQRRFKTTSEELRQELAGILNKNVDDYKLPIRK